MVTQITGSRKKLDWALFLEIVYKVKQTILEVGYLRITKRWETLLK